MPRYAFGIDLGGTNLKAAIVDAKGHVLAKASKDCDPKRGPDAVTGDVVTLCSQLLDDTSVSRDDLVGAGLGCPGPLDFAKGEIIHSVNLPGWQSVPIRDKLSNKLGLPVELENDANAAAFGEFWAGAGRDHRDMVMLTLGTGLGAGVIVRGELLHGHFDNAGELGHMIVQPDGLPCPCGQRGCLEQYSAAAAVGRRATVAVEAGEASSLAGQVTSVDVASAAKEGDALAQRIWGEACRYLAIACVNIQHGYNPAMIVLGGGMAEAGDFLLSPVRREFEAQTWRMMDDKPDIAGAVLGYDAGVIGAAGLAWTRHSTRQ